MARPQTRPRKSLLPSTQEVVRALVRLLARQAARQWLLATAPESADLPALGNLESAGHHGSGQNDCD
jgi:hypothetical protein